MGLSARSEEKCPIIKNVVVPGRFSHWLRWLSSSYNLIGNGTGLSGISNGVNHNQVGTSISPINPLLGPLSFNGGVTQTLAPESGSPAYNAGTGIPSIATDQRGVARPTSGPVDVGAIERMFGSVSISNMPAIYIRLDPNGQTIDVYYNNTGTGTPGTTYLLSDLSQLQVTGTTLNDTLTVDYSSGLPIPQNFSYNGSTGTNALTLIGSNSSDAIGLNSTTLTVGTSTITYTDVLNLVVEPLAAYDSLTLASGVTASFPTIAAGSGIYFRELHPLILNAYSQLALPATYASSTLDHSDRELLLFESKPTFGTGSTLDLGDSDADFTSDANSATLSLASAMALVKSGFNAGGYLWSGAGITSSAAANNSAHLTAIAVIQNNQNGIPLFSGSNLFDGYAPNPADVLVKYTYFGDANLDGKVDGSDYSRIDNGYLNHLTGWFNGDFNYDGVINGSDYTLIDNAFDTQGAKLATSIVSVVACPTAAARRGAIPQSQLSENWATKKLGARVIRKSTAMGVVDDEFIAQSRPTEFSDVALADLPYFNFWNGGIVQHRKKEPVSDIFGKTSFLSIGDEIKIKNEIF